jgi:hypothetical protein
MTTERRAEQRIERTIWTLTSALNELVTLRKYLAAFENGISTWNETPRI